VFTGLVESLGTINSLEQEHLKVTINENSREVILSDLAIGDSIAVDGICLTVEVIVSDGFVATASPETLQRTTLGYLQQATKYVNLETSLRMGSKLGGHFVTGHVDGIGCLVESIAKAKAWEMTFTCPESVLETWQEAIAPYLVLKGSVAVNGISLTIADCDAQGTWFKVAVIPHTYQNTNLFYLQPGDWVNLESDILGKYVNKLLLHRFGKAKTEQDLDLAFLAEHGYL
jgi:riboflavin synthase